MSILKRHSGVKEFDCFRTGGFEASRNDQGEVERFDCR